MSAGGHPAMAMRTATPERAATSGGIGSVDRRRRAGGRESERSAAARVGLAAAVRPSGRRASP
jgi:hypothetical protein